MKKYKSKNKAITALLVALILATLIFSAIGSRRDFQEILIKSHIINNIRPMASARKMVDENIKSGILDQCHGIQKIHSDAIEIYCNQSRLTAHITLPEKNKKATLYLIRDDQNSEWRCTSPLKARYIPLACQYDNKKYSNEE